MQARLCLKNHDHIEQAFAIESCQHVRSKTFAEDTVLTLEVSNRLQLAFTLELRMFGADLAGLLLAEDVWRFAGDSLDLAECAPFGIFPLDPSVRGTSQHGGCRAAR